MLELDSRDPSNHLHMKLQITLRDGDNYVIEDWTVSRDAGSPQEVGGSTVTMISTGARSGAKVDGKAPGSPIVARSFFLGAEYPMSVNEVQFDEVVSKIVRKVPLAPGHSAEYSAVIGVAPDGQMRRAVNRYVERRRAHPYRAFLHYNSWYDLMGQYTADQCVDRINAFGQALTVKRGVKLSSFLFDDGWDDYNSVWKFSKDFPDRFMPLKAAAEKYGAGPGVWLSPWGGYSTPRGIRLEAGKREGMEEDSEGYALSGPKYFKLFSDVTVDFVKNQGINQFKFDGTGSADKQYPGSAFDSDFAAAIDLIGLLRQAKPDLFVNLTTGTWPSPFWLRYADSTWRGGADHSFAGVGSWRQQWMTYRDGDTYHGVVQRGPLYPLSSLMLHGLIYAHYAQHLQDDPGNDFKSDVWAYFATGTQLQELYITPTLLTDKNWDDLADGAKWAQRNADVLVDTHWIGGDPTKLDVYGHAAWNGHKAVIELRNPSDKPLAYSLEVRRALELPANVVGSITWHSAMPGGATLKAGNIDQPHLVMLKPFEVMVIEGTTP
jgi:hypothetical protein